MGVCIESFSRPVTMATLDEILAEVQKNNRVCPLPQVHTGSSEASALPAADSIPVFCNTPRNIKPAQKQRLT